jgi:hypothetical protein
LGHRQYRRPGSVFPGNLAGADQLDDFVKAMLGHGASPFQLKNYAMVGLI